MPPKAPQGLTLASFLPAGLKSEPEQPATSYSGPRGPPRCRCEGPFDLCYRYPANTPNAACKPTWDRLLAPFQFKGREWTIVELRALWPHTVQVRFRKPHRLCSTHTQQLRTNRKPRLVALLGARLPLLRRPSTSA